MTATFEADRTFWCHVLQLSRFTVIVVYFTTLFFNFLFRTVLIRFSDRGLVTKGKPELRLFCQLYLVVVAAFVTLGMVRYPLLSMIQGTFEQTTTARVCLCETLQTEEKNISGRIKSLVYPILAEVCNQYLSWRCRVYIDGVCPNKQMSCIGKYRRNLTSFAETSFYVSCWAGYSILVEGFVIVIAMIVSKPGLTSTVVFWIHNFLAFAFVDIFHGLYIPLSMTLPSTSPRGMRSKSHKSEESAPIALEPRRWWTSPPSIAPSRPPLPTPPPPTPPPPTPPPPTAVGKRLQVTGLTVGQVCICVHSSFVGHAFLLSLLFFLFHLQQHDVVFAGPDVFYNVRDDIPDQ